MNVKRVVILVILTFIETDTTGALIANINKSPFKYENTGCDEQTRRNYYSDGIVSEYNKSPWLGLLQVHITEYSVTRTAVTGIVLVKFNYAIGNAHDVARIPENLMRTNSEAVFTPAKKGQLKFKVGRILLHEEYKKGLHSTLAIIELIEKEVGFNELKPICLIDYEPDYVFYTKDIVRMFGFTDARGNGILDQESYQLREVEKDICLKYYENNAISTPSQWPSEYYCCEETSTNRSYVCVYENGMVLSSNNVANKKGIWMLLGISARGPGCAAPSRFINIIPYMKWIIDVLSKDQRKPKGTTDIVDIKDIPNIISARRGNSLYSDTIKMRQENDYYRIVDFDRQSDTSLAVFIINETYPFSKGACKRKRLKSLTYRENTTVETYPGKTGYGVYKISLYDLFIKKYTCIKMKLDCVSRTNAAVYYSIGHEPIDDNVYAKTDKRYVIDTTKYSDIIFLNLYVRFIFSGKAELKLAFYGPSTRKPYKITPEFLINLLENKYWTDYIKENKINYTEPRGNFDNNNG